MINGNLCTRACRFCDVQSGRPGPLDPEEPSRVAEAVRRMGLGYVVITAVSRDDLPDGGAIGFARTLSAIREVAATCGREVLIPDFQGNQESLQVVLDAHPHVLNHNMETVRRLTPSIRGRGNFDRSLRVLEQAKQLRPDVLTKSGIMLGLGEQEDEVDQTLRDLRTHGVDLLTMGQYLAPSGWHHPVEAWIPPERFAQWQQRALELGFKQAACGPLVRSSYHADAAQLLWEAQGTAAPGTT